MKTLLISAALAVSAGEISAQTLDCIYVPGDVSIGIRAEAYAPPLSVSLPEGYVIVGGACDIRPQGQESPGIPASFGIVNGRYYCLNMVRSGLDTTTVRASASAIACRVAPRPEVAPPLARRAPFSNDGLGGSTFVVAINGRDATAPLPVDYRLCNTAGGAELGVDVVPGKTLRLPFGSCIDAPHPAGLAARTPETVVVDESGFYRAFAPGTFAKTQKVRLRMTNEDELDQRNMLTRVSVSAFDKHTAKCVAGQQPGGPTLHHSWAGYCAFDAIKPGANYRVCFAKGFSAQGESKLEYPGGLLPLVLNRALMAEQKSGNYIGLKYQAITYGCRDIFDAQEAFVLIADNAWNGQKIERVDYQLAEIKIVH